MRRRLIDNPKRRAQFRRRWMKQLISKINVMRRHRPGTSYHTRAVLEANTLAARIAELDKIE